MEKTLVLIKPDSVQRSLVGEIIRRFERKGLKIVGLKMMKLGDALLREHYAHVAAESFFEELSDFMSSSPVVILALEGLNAVEIVRTVAGIKSTDMGSIRGDFSVSGQRNVIHSSDSVKNAKKEIDRFFTKSELFDYDKSEWLHIYAAGEKSTFR